MAGKIRWTKKADRRYDETLLYLYQKFGEASVDSFIERTYSFLDILIDFPHIGTIEDKEKGIYGFVLEKPVTVFYKYTNLEIVIINFFDNRMSPKKRNK